MARMVTDNFGKQSERNVRHWLEYRGFKVHECGAWAPFDIRTENGTRLNVKASNTHKHRSGAIGWRFTMDRKGTVAPENAVDFYVLRMVMDAYLAGLGIVRPLHLIVPFAEVKAKHIWVSFRSLLTRRAGQIDQTLILECFDATRTADDAARAIMQADRHSSREAARRRKLIPPAERMAERTAKVKRTWALKADRKRLLAVVQQRNAAEANREA